jgi:hypothetical protein
LEVMDTASEDAELEVMDTASDGEAMDTEDALPTFLLP